MTDKLSVVEPPRPFVKAPPLHRRVMESRWLYEKASLPAFSAVLASAPRGDGHHVLMLPGFNTSDLSTIALRTYLTNLGYVVHKWGLGRNLGPTKKVVDGLAAAMDRVTNVAGAPVSLVGWSLGGMYAREMARENPEAVRFVATLGSPFRMRPGDVSTASFLANRVAKHFVPQEVIPPESTRPELSMPTTSIYTLTDGFVRWQLCLDEASSRHENIRVYGSHMGLVDNAAALYALADRLARVSDGAEWARFAPPTLLRTWYPAPASWRDMSKVQTAAV